MSHFQNNQYSALFVPAAHKNFNKNKNTKVAPAPHSGVFSMMRDEIWAAHQAAQAHLPCNLTPLPHPVHEFVMPKEAQIKIVQSKLDDLYEGKKHLQGLIESLKEEKEALLGKSTGRVDPSSFAYRANCHDHNYDMTCDKLL